MSKRRQLTPMAQVLKALPLLTEGERATLFDLLRPEPAPRKKVSKKVVREKLTEIAKVALCGVCGHTAESAEHDSTYSSSHPFQPPVASAGKRLSRSSAPKVPAATTATETVAATPVAASATGGE